LALARRATRRASGEGVAPVWLGLVADIKFFGLHKGGWIRDAILSVTDASAYEQGR
jgi:hypothetical protein